MTTPDEHIKTLMEMAEEHERALAYLDKRPHPSTGKRGLLWRQRAAALRWILEQNAWGVDESEVVV